MAHVTHIFHFTIKPITAGIGIIRSIARARIAGIMRGVHRLSHHMRGERLIGTQLRGLIVTGRHLLGQGE